jgi:hypothetical protein
MEERELPTDDGTAAILPYARCATGNVSCGRGLRRALATLGVTLALAVPGLFAIGSREYSRVCSRCGAERSASEFVIFGLAWEYRVATTQGAISRFLQRERGACIHRWVFAWSGGGYGLVGEPGCALGTGHFWLQEIRSVDALPGIALC